MAPTRDYYADLELPPTADIPEIKKQFRKLALKYHPDRNPGREEEVNSKFQIIQSAHEILTDPQAKSKYDAGRRSGRGPTASGRTGNPWADVGKNYPPPPRRSAAPKNPTSGAERWQSRFGPSVPPTAKQYQSADSETKKNAARAFENMRRSQSSAKKNAQFRPSDPPPMPPRSSPAKQRAEASFGTRKTSAQTRPAVPPDAPPRYPHAEPESPRKSRQDPMPDPLRQFRGPQQYPDDRQSAPYSTHGGERTNPFDGTPNRAKSAREPPRRDEPSSSNYEDEASGRQRSSSVPRNETGENLQVPPTGQQPTSASDAPSDFSKSSFKSRAESRSPLEGGRERPSNTSGQKGADGHSMYDIPQRNSGHQTPYPYHRPRVLKDNAFATPSGCRTTYFAKEDFESQLHKMISGLINKQQHHTVSSAQDLIPPSYYHPILKRHTDQIPYISFNFEVNDDTFVRTSPDHAKLGKSSLDDINTQFSRTNDAGAWKFGAGSGTEEDPISVPDQSSPSRRPNLQRIDTSDHSDSQFNANGWTNKFGPQTFAPQQSSNPAASPTRTSRANSKKAKPKTAGSAAVLEGSSDEDIYEWSGRRPQKDGLVDSPQAMDIDSPSVASTETQQPHGAARNIHVEPTRPEWRSGNVEGDTANPPLSPDKQSEPRKAHMGGSEDSDEFRASFADLKNVAPFSQQQSGLKSFVDLKDNLPFESKASTESPIKLPKPQPLIFPPPPEAPRLPTNVAVDGIRPNSASWNNYVSEFQHYLSEWESFNIKVVDHFAARNARISEMRMNKGYEFLAARSDVEVQEYYNWIQQDNDVRRRWNAACEDHEERFREFMAFREKMK